MVDSSKPKVKPHYVGTRRKKPVIEHETVHPDSEHIKNSVELDARDKQNNNMQLQSISPMTWLYLFLSGILGGLIALSLFMGLQWARVLPSSFVENRVGGEKALRIAEIAKSQGEETIKQLAHVLQEIDTLKTKFSSFLSQQVETIQTDEISQEESRKALTALEEKVKSLEESMQSFVEVSKDIKTALSVGQNNANALAVLKQRLETLQKELAVKNSEKNENNTALFIAISSLKNAVERGGSYSNELKTVQKLSPSFDGLDLLQERATIGFPSSAQLAANFANVADEIVRMQNIVASDAGFSERVLAWIKGLVVSRPVGNVKGMTLGAIAARMEVAIQAGDYEKALSEWQTLPQNAKDISVDFVHQLERHIAVHQLLQQLLISVQQGSLKATKR
ncbi:membrane protein [Bartonella vinsonii]|uniref:Putative membrane protein n=1 Tax=Bartonella vinsonii subsp. berkhoffii str. Tweed TaxID=1094502 RepID=N6VIQ7_BARVB|nr:membrane protein [Bartonella vinsonii]AGF76528.1 putative membrane protein [Bartonella vinsonii subsp. berkhoffii str. Winnie]ENN93076.1 putative membrane protein [Bartonella vinsonii subsp. berkhoffii str. Tweed]